MIAKFCVIIDKNKIEMRIIEGIKEKTIAIYNGENSVGLYNKLFDMVFKYLKEGDENEKNY